MPAFHWYEDGSSESYLKTIIAGGPCVESPLVPMLWSCEYRTVVDVENGGLPTCENTELPFGRSKKRPAPPRRMNFWSPPRS